MGYTLKQIALSMADLIVGLGIAAINADAAMEVYRPLVRNKKTEFQTATLPN